jgi:5-formyltetrahydrofolate cyclo-ligase
MDATATSRHAQPAAETEPDPGAPAVKWALRRRLRAARRARSPEEQEQVAGGLTAVALEMPELQAARCVALYASMAGEPGTAALREVLRRRGVRVLLPVVCPDFDLDWAEDDGATEPAGTLAIPHPGGPRLGLDAVGEADVVLAPGLAVDSRGSRLGNGGGCYDRALRRVGAGATVAVLLHEEELLDAAAEPIPLEPHDVLVPRVVTPSRWVILSSSPDRG